MRDDQTLRLDPETRLTLQELQRPGEPDIYQHLTNLFISDSEKLLQQLRQRMLVKEFASLHELAHQWKNNALGIGAFRLGKYCQMLEIASRNSASETELKDIAKAIEIEFGEVVALLQSGAN